MRFCKLSCNAAFFYDLAGIAPSAWYLIFYRLVAEPGQLHNMGKTIFCRQPAHVLLCEVECGKTEILKNGQVLIIDRVLQAAAMPFPMEFRQYQKIPCTG